MHEIQTEIEIFNDDVTLIYIYRSSSYRYPCPLNKLNSEFMQVIAGLREPKLQLSLISYQFGYMLLYQLIPTFCAMNSNGEIKESSPQVQDYSRC